MPTVPMLPDEGKGLLADNSSQPDASSILKAVSLMHSMGRLGPGAGGIEHVGPRRAKAPKGSGRTRSMLR